MLICTQITKRDRNAAAGRRVIRIAISHCLVNGYSNRESPAHKPQSQHSSCQYELGLVHKRLADELGMTAAAGQALQQPTQRPHVP
jgi:hypothetical protein